MFLCVCSVSFDETVRCGYKRRHWRGSGNKITLKGPRNRRHRTPRRATWGSLRVGREQKVGAKGKPRLEPLLGFLHFRTG